MAGIPPEYGGDRVFDAEAKDALTTTSNLAAANLQYMYLIKASKLMAPEHEAMADQVAEHMKLALKQADDISLRERSTRVHRPLTIIPREDYGNIEDLGRVRLSVTDMFDGSKSDPGEVSRWLSKIFDIAQSHKLKLPVVVQLLARAATGPAYDYIEQIRAENKSLAEVVELLEMRYGNLCSPEEAVVKCNTMAREVDEDLSAFLGRLRQMARVAYRYEDNDKKRNGMVDDLVVANLRRALSVSIRIELENRILARTRMGLKAFKAREMEKECLDLERVRLERRKEVIKQASMYQKKGGKFAHIAMALVAQQNFLDHGDLASVSDDLIGDPGAFSVGTSGPASSGLQDMSPLASEDEEEGDVFLARQIQREKMKFQAAGQPVNDRRAMKGAIRKYNDRFAGKKNWNNQRVVGEVVQAPGAQQRVVQPQAPYYQSSPLQAAPQQPPLAQDDLRNKPIFELLQMSKCVKGHCIQCGLPGHTLGRDGCPLRGLPLVNTPCVTCGTGLHSSDYCIKTFIGRQPAQVSSAQESLN